MPHRFKVVIISTLAVCSRAWLPSSSKNSLPQKIPSASCWNSDSRHTTTSAFRNPTGLKYSEHNNQDSPEAARPLELTKEDLQRLSEMQSRQATIPIVILDALLPGQTLAFKSGSDTKFRKMLEYAMDSDSQEIGILGFNPHTGDPMSSGVTSLVRHDTKVKLKGHRQFEVIGEPYLEPSGAFHLARVEIIDNREEFMTPEHRKQANTFHNSIPRLVDEWIALVLEEKYSTSEAMEALLQEIGPMPSSMRERSNWVGSLVNPMPSLKVCIEVRPALLSCRSDFERMILATTALQSSIDHMTGENKLKL